MGNGYRSTHWGGAKWGTFGGAETNGVVVHGPTGIVVRGPPHPMRQGANDDGASMHLGGAPTNSRGTSGGGQGGEDEERDLCEMGRDRKRHPPPPGRPPRFNPKIGERYRQRWVTRTTPSTASPRGTSVPVGPSVPTVKWAHTPWGSGNAEALREYTTLRAGANSPTGKAIAEGWLEGWCQGAADTAKCRSAEECNTLKYYGEEIMLEQRRREGTQ